MKPVFQMPFMCHQTWLATTYDGHYPNPNSLGPAKSRTVIRA
jgi:hypothetical protein